VGGQEEGRGRGAVDEDGASPSAASSFGVLTSAAFLSPSFTAPATAATDGVRQEDDAPLQPARDQGPQGRLDDDATILEVLEPQRRQGGGRERGGGGGGGGGRTAAVSAAAAAAANAERGGR